MLKELEEKIEEVDILTDFDKIEDMDILTDFDGTMIIERSPYTQINAYRSYLRGYKKIEFIIMSIKGYNNYKKTGDVSFFYSLFEGCPIEVIDKSTDKLRQNDEWLNVIDRLNPEKIGIVSQNNKRFIRRYSSTRGLSGKIRVVKANVPEIKNGFYTGRVKIYVNNENLIDFVKKKEYICGEDEKKILENCKDKDLRFEKVASGLYICYKQKIFSLWTKKKQLELVK